MKRKVFITGISSELISRFAQLIDQCKFEITGLTRKENYTAPNVQIKIGDILNISSFAEELSGCDTIVHAAAVTHSFKKESYFETNLEATKKLVDLAKEKSVNNFILVSSNTAGDQSGAYGLSKLLAEQYVKQNLTNWTVLRPAEIYGGTKNEGIEALIHNALTKRVILCPKGVPTDFYPIHIDDAVNAMHQAAFGTISTNEIKVIASSKGYSFLDIIELAKAISKRNPRIIFIKKSWMFLIRDLASLLPFSIGIIPDQIDRLYATKDVDGATKETSAVNLADYIQRVAGS